MDSDSVVKISLAGAHFHSNSEALNNLVAALADDVHTDDPFFRALYDELEFCGLLVCFLDHAKVQSLEGRFV